MKKAIVVHSGGMDSSICLAIAIKKYGKDSVLSLGFDYGQRHSQELLCAQQVASYFQVERFVIKIDFLKEITQNSLTHHHFVIEHEKKEPNSLVVGRNGLMTRIAAIHAHNLGANEIYLGVMELESENSGYRDCSRAYMNSMEEILRIDLDNKAFKIETPLVHMTKFETMELAHGFGVLEYLLDNTLSCYEGIGGWGCQKCPACLLKNKGLHAFIKAHPDFALPASMKN